MANPLIGICKSHQLSGSGSWDIYNTGSRFERLVKSIPKWKTSQENRQKMLDFLKRVEVEGVGIVQRVKYIDSFRTFLSVINKDFADVTEKDIEQFLYEMQHYKPATRHLRWVCMRKFMRYQGKEDIYKKLKPSFKILNHRLPEELLTKEEVDGMADAIAGLMNKCLIKTLYESGCRSGELLTLRLKHVSFDDKGVVLMVDGKTGQRRIRLVESTALLKQWIEKHPTGEMEDLLWTRPNKKPIKHGYLRCMVEKAALLSGVKKKVHPHLFRHSRATHLAKFLTESEMKIFFGWQGASKMAATYVHLSGKDVEDKILGLYEVKQSHATNNTEVMEFFAFMMRQFKEVKTA